MDDRQTASLQFMQNEVTCDIPFLKSFPLGRAEREGSIAPHPSGPRERKLPTCENADSVAMAPRRVNRDGEGNMLALCRLAI